MPVTPCLWFDGNADEAVDHYLSVFPDSRRTGASEYGDDGPGEAGSTMVVTFELDGTPFMALNGGPEFRFGPATSFVVSCADQDEVDHYWRGLGEGGTPGRCGWLTDRFGLSWQVVPRRLAELLGAPDAEAAGRVMSAMLAMDRLDIAALEAAAASDGRP